MDPERKRIAEAIIKAFPDTEKDECVSADNAEGETILFHEVQKLLPQIRKMSDLLEKHDVEARDVYRSIEPELTHAAPKFAKELGIMLGKFDFTHGRTKVERFISECEQEERENG